MSDPELVFIPCPLCGSEDAILFCEDSGMAFRRCAGCGLVFLNPRPPSQTFAESAGVMAEEEVDRPASPSAWSRPRVKGFVRGASLISRHVSGGRLLDIGCGDGRFLLIMGELGGFELHGLEPDAGEAARASRLLGIDIFCGTLEEAGYADSFFDVVTMWDVLEHVHQPLRELREVRRILKDEGLLLARVPNLSYFRLKDLVAGPYMRWRGMTVYNPGHHLTYLDRLTTVTLLREADFAVLDMRPSRSEYGWRGARLSLRTVYHAAAMAAYFLTAGRVTLTVDLLVLARPSPARETRA